MQLPNLSVDRIIIHQIYQRGQDGNKVEPSQSHEYTNFDKSAMDAFISRVRDALGEGSKAVKMQIVNQAKNGLPALIDELIDKNDDDFAVSSFDLAQKLTDAQHRKSIPGGIVVVFTGRKGFPEQKFLGIIKAEIHSAYQKEKNPENKEISLKFVEEVLLTPGSRLYKTAAFFRTSDIEAPADLNEKYSIMVSDYQISKVDGKAAAQYFYSDFLGCGYPETSARTTKKFYEVAREFIDSMNVDAEKKSDYVNALTTYLKVGQSSTISVQEFGSTFFDVETQDIFMSRMEESGLPTTAFTKDLDHIQAKLKFRKINFSKNVKIIAPSEVFKECVVIESIDGEPDEVGSPQTWTKVTIKDRITEQE